MNVTRVEKLTLDHLPAVELFLRGLPFHPSDWDRRLSETGHVSLAMNSLRTDLDNGSGIAVVNGGEIRGTCVLAMLPWNSAFFGVPCARVSSLRALDEASARLLVSELNDMITRCGFVHVYTSLDVRETDVSFALQRGCWRVVWTCIKMIGEISRIDRGSTFRTKVGSFEVVPFEETFRPAILDIAGRIGGYTWLEKEERLPVARRQKYIMELVRRCLDSDFADLNLVLLKDGRPIGMNSSKLAAYPPDVGTIRLSLERNTFIDPKWQGSGCGRILWQGVARILKERVEYITGRVRLDSPEIIKIHMQNDGECRGGEYYLGFEG